MLKGVYIGNCPMIDASFPRGLWPPNLCFLGIGGLKKPISEWGNQNFPPSLVYLCLWDEPDVRNFSRLSHLFPSSLTSLDISEFYNLESLSTGLQHLTSLQHLTIHRCPKVKDLPETLLPSLLSLMIDECPKLEERCSGRGSHYWPRISHIPCIFMDGRSSELTLVRVLEHILMDLLGDGTFTVDQVKFKNREKSQGVNFQGKYLG
ncbi:putative leucine-rich repeat domain superfamily [Helianthus anomalus]